MGRGDSSLKEEEEIILWRISYCPTGSGARRGCWERCVCTINRMYSRHAAMKGQWIYEARRNWKRSWDLCFLRHRKPQFCPDLPTWSPQLIFLTVEKIALFTTLHLPLCLSLPSKLTAHARLLPSKHPWASHYLLNPKRIPPHWQFLPLLYKFISLAVR